MIYGPPFMPNRHTRTNIMHPKAIQIKRMQQWQHEKGAAASTNARVRSPTFCSEKSRAQHRSNSTAAAAAVRRQREAWVRRQQRTRFNRTNNTSSGGSRRTTVPQQEARKRKSASAPTPQQQRQQQQHTGQQWEEGRRCMSTRCHHRSLSAFMNQCSGVDAVGSLLGLFVLCNACPTVQHPMKR